MKKIITLFLIIITTSLGANAQVPNAINYQLVVRDASGELVINQNIGLQLTIYQGSTSGTTVYQEVFSLTTNNYALINTQLGTGTPVQGDFTTIDWANGSYFVEVAVDFTGGTNYVIMGTSQLVSVPYAMHAKTAENVFSGDYQDLINAPTNVSVFTNDIGYLVSEQDGDTTNEIQALTISNDTIYLTNGGSVVLPAGFDGQYSSLTGAPTVVSAFTNDAGYLVTEMDGDPVNEIQTLSISNNTISLTNGGSVQLPDEIDGDTTNELQFISKSGNTVSLSLGGGTFVDAVDDADNNPLNEIQSINIVNDSLEISGANRISINNLNHWTKTGDTIQYFNPVGVGATPDIALFQLYNDRKIGSGNEVMGMKIDVLGKSSNNWENTAILATINTDTSEGRAVSAVATGINGGYGFRSETSTDSWNEAVSGIALSKSSSADYQVGVYGEARKGWSETSAGTGDHYGGLFVANGAGSTIGLYGYGISEAAGNNFGVYGNAASTTAGNNLGVYARANTATSGNNYGLYSFTKNASGSNYGVYSITDGSGNDNAAIYGRCFGSTSFNTGVDGTTEAQGATNIGVGGYAFGNNTGSNINYAMYAYAQNADTNYGVYATLAGNNTVNYGVYSEASGATVNYAGYFVGDVTINGNLNVTGGISKGSGTFKIDHPNDPANKYLVHSFVESPDMMNVYNGNVVTDAQGYATVILPKYFEKVNKDFRYQLTVIGTFAQAIVLEEVSGNKFKIQTNHPNVKVSWQVTGIRNDPYAQANRIESVQDKPEGEKGTYLHPEVYGKDISRATFGPKGSKAVIRKKLNETHEEISEVEPVKKEKKR